MKLRVLVLCFSYFTYNSIGLLFIRFFLGERRFMYHLFHPLDLHHNQGARMKSLMRYAVYVVVAHDIRPTIAIEYLPEKNPPTDSLKNHS
jgi:hypothetical protein